MNQYGTKPEFEVYEVGMISDISYFVKKGLLKGPVYIQFVLGVMGGLPATVDNLLFLYNTAENLLEGNFNGRVQLPARRKSTLLLRRSFWGAM